MKFRSVPFIMLVFFCLFIWGISGCTTAPPHPCDQYYPDDREERDACMDDFRNAAIEERTR